MTWYAAGLILAIKLKSGNQDVFPVLENVVIVEAENFDKAREKAKMLGKNEALSGNNLIYCGQPAFMEFMGIRKIKKTHSLDDDEIGSSQPKNGTEIIEFYFEINGKNELNKFCDGKRVQVDYVDDDE